MVSEIPILTHPKIPGVSIIPFETVKVGQPQSILVRMDPNAIIPEHAHGVGAEMYPVSGSATLIADDPHFSGRRVIIGNRVKFAAGQPHGFIAGSEGFSFVSVNGGIIDSDPANWDIAFV